MFEFQGKTYKIIEDRVGELVAGCKRCAFTNDTDKCSDVDGPGTNRETCCRANVHYEEVPA